MIPISTFGEKLKRARLAAGLTQEALANKCGMKKQNISRYEKSDREPNVRIASKLANALGVSLGSLVDSKLPELDLQFFAGKEQDEDAELKEYLDMLRTRPECRVLLDTIKGATKEEVEANVRFIEALRREGK